MDKRASITQAATTTASTTIATTSQIISNPETNKKRRITKDESSNERQKRLKGIKITPCGISLNWQTNVKDIEQLVGAKGILQRKKSKCSNYVMKSILRLSRYSLNVMALEALQLSKHGRSIDGIVKAHSYQQLKDVYAPMHLRRIMKLVQKECKNPLQGWIRSSAEYDFSLCCAK